MGGQVGGETSKCSHCATLALGWSHRNPGSVTSEDTASEELRSRSRQSIATAHRYHLCKPTSGHTFRMCFQTLLKRIKGDSRFCQFFPPASTGPGGPDMCHDYLSHPFSVNPAEQEDRPWFYTLRSNVGFIIAGSASPSCKK